MPLIQLDTSCDLSTQQKRDTLAQQLSKIVAQGIGKPQEYAMALVQDKATIAIGGLDPAALVIIKSIGGLSSTVNQTLSSEVCALLQRELDISSDRVYITFEDVAPTHWGWKGKTFG